MGQKAVEMKQLMAELGKHSAVISTEKKTSSEITEQAEKIEQEAPSVQGQSSTSSWVKKRIRLKKA